MNKERLLQLADHLEKGKLGHEVFDFRNINIGNTEPNVCGTNGCAIGEMPIVWPDKIVFSQNTVMELSSQKYGFSAAAHFFGIDLDDEAEFLFAPLERSDFRHPSMLYGRATKEHVAAHIRKFVENGGIYED